VLIVWGNDFSHVTPLMNGLPLLIRDRTERKIYGLTTDVAEDWLLIHGSPPLSIARMDSRRLRRFTQTRPEKPERDVA
jgi:hypothetical protein